MINYEEFYLQVTYAKDIPKGKGHQSARLYPAEYPPVGQSGKQQKEQAVSLLANHQDRIGS